MTNIVFFVTAGLVNVDCDHRFAQNTNNIQVLGYSWQDTHNPGPASPGWGIELAYVGGSRFIRLQFVHSFVFFFRNASYWSRPESSQPCKLRRYPSLHSMLIFTCSKPVLLPPTLHNSAGIPTQVSCHDRCRAGNAVHFDCLFCIPDCARCTCAERTASSARGYRRSCQGGTREGDPRDCASIDRGASEAQAEPYIEDQHWLRGQSVCTLTIETSLWVLTSH
jgi:hypothetical protein